MDTSGFKKPAESEAGLAFVNTGFFGPYWTDALFPQLIRFRQCTV